MWHMCTAELVAPSHKLVTDLHERMDPLAELQRFGILRLLASLEASSRGREAVQSAV